MRQGGWESHERVSTSIAWRADINFSASKRKALCPSQCGVRSLETVLARTR